MTKLPKTVREYLSTIGAKGGAAGKGKPASPKKAAAARKNAKLGGRPRDKKPSAGALYRREYRAKQNKEGK